MSTTTTTPTIPEWMKESPKHTYNLTAFDEGGDGVQEAELTLNEYDLLKRHLAKLRGLTPDTEDTAAQPVSDSKESDDPAIDPKKPGALTLARLVGLHKDSIGILEAEIQGLTKMVNDGTLPKGFLLGRALDAELLSDLLQLWDSGGYGREYPEDGRLLATMKERCTL
jgi:hypothetical protein